MQRFHISRKQLIILTICMIIVSGVVGWVFFGRQFKSKDSQTDYSVLCNTDEIGTQVREQYPYFDSFNTKELAPIVENIQQLPDYDKSPSCLYILGKQAMYKGEFVQAADYLDALVELHESNGSWFNPNFGVEDVSDIRERIASLRESAGTLNNRTTWQKIENEEEPSQ